MSTTGGRPPAGGAERSATTAGPPRTAAARPVHPGQGAAPPRTGGPRPAPAGRRPEQRTGPTAAPGDAEPRKVKLTVSRVDPFSVLKVGFLLSVAIGIAGVVVVAALWLMLNSMGVFQTINDSVNELQSSTNAADRISVLDFLGFGRILSLSIVFGVVNVILMTAIATIVAFIYNICAALVGGVQVTLTDD